MQKLPLYGCRIVKLGKNAPIYTKKQHIYRRVSEKYYVYIYIKLCVYIQKNRGVFNTSILYIVQKVIM